MSIQIIRISRPLFRAAIVAVAVVGLALTWYSMRWHFANAIAGHFDRSLPEASVVFEWLVDVGPGDPLTHVGYAITLEKTFDPEAFTRSLTEYERAVAVSPNDYRLWLTLGRARSAAGDAAGAEAAFKKALDLAPNYSAIQWTYGNFLVRQGEPERGFRLVSQAAAIDQQYAAPAVTTALQIFDGDAARVRQAMGDNDVTNASLAATLPASERYDAAIDAWSRLSDTAKKETYKELGQRLIDTFIKGKRYRSAARVAADLEPDEGLRPVTGQIANGGFESGVKLRQAGMFEWRISEGGQPQVAQSEGQKRSGRFSLSLTFNTFDASSIRDIAELVPVEPGATYELQSYHRSDLKTNAAFHWQIVNASDQSPIASTPAFALAGDWASSTVKFTVPAATDGIMIRLTHDGCAGPACPINGKLLFDDISLRRLQ